MSETESTILSRLVNPETASLSADAARSILTIKFAQQDVDRMHMLLAKGNEGTITPDERAEAETYERVGHMLALLQSKARKSLMDSTSAA